MILLVDMDAFFASVEQAHHPHLRGHPVIVCGDPSRRGVVTAASYEARPSGVKAGMSLREARRLCPDAHYVEGDPEKYVAISLSLLNLYLTLTPEVEPFSVDEAFLGVGGIRTDGGLLRDAPRPMEAARAIAARLQRTIEERFGLTASIGAGPNKLIAKMAAGVCKPRGLTALDEEGFRRAFWPREVQALWGVGPQLAARLRLLGISVVGDLARAPEPALRGAFGVIGPQLREAAWGRDDTALVPYHQGVDAKSMGHEVTLPEDSAEPAHLEGTILRLADQVARRLRTEGFSGRTVCLKLRDHRFRTWMRQCALRQVTDDPQRIFSAALRLWRDHWRGERLRLLGVSVSGLIRSRPEEQTELFEPQQRGRELLGALDRIRDKLGEASVVPAATLAHRRAPGHVPFGTVRSRGPSAAHAPGPDPVPGRRRKR